MYWYERAEKNGLIKAKHELLKAKYKIAYEIYLNTLSNDLKILNKVRALMKDLALNGYVPAKPDWMASGQDMAFSSGTSGKQ